MQSMNDVRDRNAQEFSTQTRSQLYKQWQRFTSAQSSAFRIGIWGTTGAGKTTFLAMLYDSLLLRPGWTVAADHKARTFVTSHLRTLRTKGRFPPPTEVTAETDIFRYILQEEQTAQSDGAFNQVTLDFVDAPGEFYEKPHQADRRVTGEMDILDYLSSCHGIIFLLDPDRIDDDLGDDEDDYRTMMLDLMLEFQERSLTYGLSDDLRLEQYMAFCITKADKEPYWSNRNSPQNLAEEIMGNIMYRMLGANFCKLGRYNFFATSAIGRYQDLDSNSWLENVQYPSGHVSNGHSGTIVQPNIPIANPAVTTTNIGPAFESSPSSSSATAESEAQPARRSSWAPAKQNHQSSKPVYAPETSIRNKQAINPLNIIEPLDWLVDSMRREAPRIFTK